MTLIRKLISWLTYHPTCDEIARALATDYLKELSVQGIRFSRLQNDDSIIILGQFSFLKGQRQDRWCNNSSVYLETLLDRGVTQGHLMVAFHKSVSESDKNRVAETIRDLCVPLALYLSFLSQPLSGSIGTQVPGDLNSRETGAGQLSARQLSILRGMVEGKTNHELATEMGFSVSTIRHETMRIYQALAVSDRKEAAKKAIMLSLI